MAALTKMRGGGRTNAKLGAKKPIARILDYSKHPLKANPAIKLILSGKQWIKSDVFRGDAASSHHG